MQPTTFIEALATVFDELPEQEITPDVTEDMLTGAARRVLEERDADSFRFKRYVDPDSETTLTAIEDVHGKERILLSAEEVAQLRSHLMVWDESVPPRAGDPYLTPVEKDDGTLQKTYQPEE